MAGAIFGRGPIRRDAQRPSTPRRYGSEELRQTRRCRPDDNLAVARCVPLIACKHFRTHRSPPSRPLYTTCIRLLCVSAGSDLRMLSPALALRSKLLSTVMGSELLPPASLPCGSRLMKRGNRHDQGCPESLRLQDRRVCNLGCFARPSNETDRPLRSETAGRWRCRGIDVLACSIECYQATLILTPSDLY